MLCLCARAEYFQPNHLGKHHPWRTCYKSSKVPYRVVTTKCFVSWEIALIASERCAAQIITKTKIWRNVNHLSGGKKWKSLVGARLPPRRKVTLWNRYNICMRVLTKSASLTSSMRLSYRQCTASHHSLLLFRAPLSVVLSVESVRKKLSKLNPCKENGADNILGWMLTEHADILAGLVSDILNYSYREGRLPSS